MGSGFVSIAHVDPRQQGDTPPPARPIPPEVRAAIAGDRAATERLLRQVAPRVFDTARAICGPTHPELDDVVQETLVALMRALPQFEGRSSVAHFATRIAARTAIAARKRARARAQPDDERVAFAEETASKLPYQQLLRETRRAMVRALLDELPPAQSEALALRFCAGLSMEEIAESTGTPLNTVYSRLRLAKAALRARITEDPSYDDLRHETER